MANLESPVIYIYVWTERKRWSIWKKPTQAQGELQTVGENPAGALNLVDVLTNAYIIKIMNPAEYARLSKSYEPVTFAGDIINLSENVL